MFADFVAPPLCTLGPVVIMVIGGWYATRSARPENQTVNVPEPVEIPATASKQWEYYGPVEGWCYR